MVKIYWQYTDTIVECADPVYMRQQFYGETYYYEIRSDVITEIYINTDQDEIMDVVRLNKYKVKHPEQYSFDADSDYTFISRDEYVAAFNRLLVIIGVNNQ